MLQNLDEKLNEMGPIALSNPWFGVGGLERVYLAVTSVKRDATIVVAKNFHDQDSFSFYFGDHKPFPEVFDIDLMVEGDSPHVHLCMNAALERYFATAAKSHAAHVTNHWGLFFTPPASCEITLVYFQPGVWEMEQIKKNPVLFNLYRDILQERRVLANSMYMKDILKQDFDCEATVLYPCTDTEYFLQGDDKQTKRHDVMIFSRLNPGKQFTAALDMFKDITRRRPKTRYVIAGAIRREEMNFLEQLKELAAKNGLERSITFVPNPSLQDLKALYEASKLLAFLPKNEPLGLVPVEAMVAGVPVVAFNSGGATETVMQDKTGILCDDEEGMVDAIVDLLDDPEKADAMRENSSLIQEKFSERSFLSNLINIIEG
ncbi:MAG TPA: glycosyltransferase family 4 protein [Candidatus Lokiarchaeia archaeon]|nr:glycosyltransferase family 4 protein [Candidatus Lokiarchaeia archaeon]